MFPCVASAPPSQLQSQEEFQEAIKRQMEEQMRVYHQMQSQSKMFTEMQALQFQQMADRQREVGEGRGRGEGGEEGSDVRKNNEWSAYVAMVLLHCLCYGTCMLIRTIHTIRTIHIYNTYVCTYVPCVFQYINAPSYQLMT